jgi:hypothetical protein
VRSYDLAVISVDRMYALHRLLLVGRELIQRVETGRSVYDMGRMEHTTRLERATFGLADRDSSN